MDKYFFGGAGLGILETDNSVITPYIGGSWTINDYIEDQLSQFNYNSTSAYALYLPSMAMDGPPELS